VTPVAIDFEEKFINGLKMLTTLRRRENFSKIIAGLMDLFCADPLGR
jgi:hypothetical protein